MPSAWNDAAGHQRREYRPLSRRDIGCRASQRIGGPVQEDRWGRNLRALRELPLHLSKPRFARRICVPMAIGMNHHVDEIGVVERRRGQVVFIIAEAPAWRPGGPEKLA